MLDEPEHRRYCARHSKKFVCSKAAISSSVPIHGANAHRIDEPPGGGRRTHLLHCAEGERVDGEPV